MTARGKKRHNRNDPVVMGSVLFGGERFQRERQEPDGASDIADAGGKHGEPGAPRDPHLRDARAHYPCGECVETRIHTITYTDGRQRRGTACELDRICWGRFDLTVRQDRDERNHGATDEAGPRVRLAPAFASEAEQAVKRGARASTRRAADSSRKGPGSGRASSPAAGAPAAPLSRIAA